MKIQKRILVVMILIIMIFLTGLSFYHYFEKKRAYKIFQDEKTEVKSFFEQLLKLKGESLEMHVYDYTFWDEMVRFVQEKKLDWAAVNIDSSLATHKDNAMWVYSLQKNELIYHANNIGEQSIVLNLDSSFFQQLVQERFAHFFYVSNYGLLEIRAGTIHPSQDEARMTPPQGFLLAARLWNESYIQHLMELSHCQIHVISPDAPDYSIIENIPKTFSDPTINFSKILPAWNSGPCVKLHMKYESRLIHEFYRFSFHQLFLLTLFAVFILLVVFIFLTSWILTPVNLLSRSLDTENPDIIKKLEKDPSEFGELAKLIRRFFSQKQQMLQDMLLRQQAEERWQSLVENAPDIIITSNLEGQITFINHVLPEFDYDTVVGSSIYQYVLPEHQSLVRENILKVLKTHQAQTYEVATLNPYLWFSCRIGPIWDDDRIVGIIIISTDITERKKALDQIQQLNLDLENRVQERTHQLLIANQELERSNKDLEQFAYTASHDLQEPLRMISGFTELLVQRHMKDRKDKDSDQFVEFILAGVERMHALIQDLLTYSRVGSRQINIQSVNTKLILDRILTYFKDIIQSAHIEITWDTMPIVQADPLQFEQLLQNLIGNAIKFRNNTAHPTIHIQCPEREKEWLFGIQDNGIGIAPEHQEHIFKIFQRLHTKEEYPGTGLGLAICKKILERHGGQIWVESSINQGCIFYFTLPKKALL